MHASEKDFVETDKRDPAAKPRVKKVPLVECFGPTIQGEGSVIGQQTYFLRFGLCDYKCTRCDSMHAVDPHSVKKFAKFLTPEEIMAELNGIRKTTSTHWVTLSGGNPAIHDLTALLALLKADGWRVAVETQGTFSPTWLNGVDILICSPKGPGMGEVCDIPTLDAFVHYNAPRHLSKFSLKVVVFDQRDLDFAAEVFHRYAGFVSYDQCFLSLGNPNPPDEDGQSDVNPIKHQQELLQYYRILSEDIMQHPVLSKVKFLPQWHVFVWGNGQGH
jgi:7-carboxy-7-deazaguanine synthase